MPATARKPKPRIDTWQSYQRLFSDHLEATNKAPMTIRTYLIAFDQLASYLRGSLDCLDPTQATREMLIDWVRYLQRPKADGGQELSPASVVQRYRSVSVFFKWLTDIEELAENPMAKMKPPQLPEKLVPVVGQQDLAKLFKVCGGTGFEERRDKAIISLFIDTGIRLAEMAGLNLDDIDFAEREVTVMGKGRRPRVLRMVKETRSDLERYRLSRIRHPHADEEAFWLGRKGRLNDSGIYQMIERRCEQAGIPRIHPHQLRHTFAHNYLLNGGNEGDLMRVTGWRSRSMVDRYGASAATTRAHEAHDRFSPRKGL
ncbi:MAG: tyrosine-type recombinase/integrase [Dehalococcoidia bacterium]|nr:tyrosine-type recombinase/integrase [Dehalococcoidia bacterium]